MDLPNDAYIEFQKLYQEQFDVLPPLEEIKIVADKLFELYRIVTKTEDYDRHNTIQN